MDLAIDSIQALRGRYPDGPPPQIIHVSVISREAAKRMADLGIVAVTQPHFLKLPVFETMPKPPGLIIQPVRTLLETVIRYTKGEPFRGADSAKHGAFLAEGGVRLRAHDPHGKVIRGVAEGGTSGHVWGTSSPKIGSFVAGTCCDTPLSAAGTIALVWASLIRLPVP